MPERTPAGRRQTQKRIRAATAPAAVTTVPVGVNQRRFRRRRAAIQVPAAAAMIPRAVVRRSLKK